MTDTTHECPGPGCERRVPRHQLACPKCYSRVHGDTKRELYEAYRSGNLARHAAAMADAIEDMTPKAPRSQR